jgi:hypothetical protein
MLVIAERYTVDGLGGDTEHRLGGPKLLKEGGWYRLQNALFNKTSPVNRVSFNYRLFDKESGSITRTSIVMDKRQRREFVNWLKHLSNYMMEDPDETRKIIKGPNYVLKGVPISMGGRE